MELMVNHLGNGLYLILILSLPVTLTAALIGLIIGILQAVTQVQEQTISAAPKILAVFLLIIFGGGLMMNLLTTYLRESVMIAFQEVPAVGLRLLPPLAEPDSREERIQEFFKEQVRHGSGGPNLGQMKGVPKGASENLPPIGLGSGSSDRGRVPTITEELHINKKDRNPSQ